MFDCVKFKKVAGGGWVGWWEGGGRGEEEAGGGDGEMEGGRRKETEGDRRKQKEERRGERFVADGRRGAGGGAGGAGVCGSDDSKHGVSVQARADDAPKWWHNTWEQAPGVPATPSPP